MSEYLQTEPTAEHTITTLREVYRGSSIEGNFPPTKVLNKIQYCLTVLAAGVIGKRKLFPLDARYTTNGASITLESSTDISALAEAYRLARNYPNKSFGVTHLKSLRPESKPITVLDGIVHKD